MKNSALDSSKIKYVRDHAEDYIFLKESIKKWLSVAESQMCALDVVSHQLPNVRNILEENVEAISTHFTIFAKEINSQRLHIEDMKKTIDESGDSEEIKNKLDILGEYSDKLSKELMECIVRMQFQDRISQNLVIATNVIAEIKDYLDSSIDYTTHALEDMVRSKNLTLDKGFAKKMLKHLTLGELQHKFVSDLINHGYIENEGELGIADIGASDEGEIELF